MPPAQNGVPASGSLGGLRPEESVDFLCKKFSNLFTLLQQTESEKQALEADRNAIQNELEQIKTRAQVHTYTAGKPADPLCRSFCSLDTRSR